MRHGQRAGLDARTAKRGDSGCGTWSRKVRGRSEGEARGNLWLLMAPGKIARVAYPTPACGAGDVPHRPIWPESAPRVATLTWAVADSCQSCCAAPRNGLWGEHSWWHRLSWARKIASDSSMVWVTPCLTRGAYPSFTPPGMSSPGAKAAPQGSCAPQTL